MALKLNPATGMLEDDGTGLGAPIPLPSDLPTGPTPQQQAAMRSTLRTGAAATDPTTGLAVQPSGTPIVTGLPAGWTAEQAYAAGLARPAGAGQDAGAVTTGVAPPVAPVPKRMETEASSTTTNRHIISPAEKANLAAQDLATEEAVTAERAASAVRKDVARTQQEAAEEQARESAARQIEQRQIVEQGQQDYEQAVAAHQQAFDDYKKTGFKDFWSSRSTGDKVLAGLGVLLGGLGGGQNRALEQLNRTIDLDLAKQKFEIGKAHEGIEFAEKGIGFARERAQMRQTDFALKKAAALEATADKFQAMLLRTGVSAEQASSDQRVLALRQQSLQLQEQVLAQTRTQVSSTVQRKLVEGTGAGAGAGGKVSTEDVKEINRLNGDLASIDRTIDQIRKNPNAWTEYRDNLESFRRKEAASSASSSYKGARGVLQGLGIADVSPDQGLKTESGRVVHRGMEDVNTSIAKGYGGVITEGDRAAAGASLGSLATQNPLEALKTLQQIRNKLASARDNFIVNRGVNPGQISGQAAPAAGGAFPPAAAGAAPSVTRPNKAADYAAAARWLQSDEAKKPENRAMRLRVAQQLSMLGGP